MAFVGAVRGVSGRQGIFLSGKPQQLVACDDGLVLVSASGFNAPLGGPLAGSLLANEVRAATSGKDVTASALGASLKRATTVLWPDVESAELESRFPGRKLRLVVAGVTSTHGYGKLHDDDRWLVPLLADRLGARFTDSR